MAMNHFADWTQEEFEAMLLPNKGRPGRPSLGSTVFDGVRVRLHRPEVNAAHLLPSYVDWRGTPADSPVKDQAACGSCWVSHILCRKLPSLPPPHLSYAEAYLRRDRRPLFFRQCCPVNMYKPKS